MIKRNEIYSPKMGKLSVNWVSYYGENLKSRPHTMQVKLLRRNDQVPEIRKLVRDPKCMCVFGLQSNQNVYGWIAIGTVIASIRSFHLLLESEISWSCISYWKLGGVG